MSMSTSLRRHAPRALAAFALATALAGCADDSTTTARFNEADVTFAQQMIPHHQQALEMAQLAETRAGNPEVRELAAGIAGAQEPEIETMTGWLEAWGEEVPSGSMDHGDMGHGSSEPMPGMMSADEMADLEGSAGADFDRMFLEMMVEHHSGAVEMAQAEQADGEHPDTVALAAQIESDQKAEITTMQQLLEG